MCVFDWLAHVCVCLVGVVRYRLARVWYRRRLTFYSLRGTYIPERIPSEI